MERVQVLIDKLVQQKQQNESAAQLLLTVQLLQNELMQLQQKKDSKSTAKVAVVMPSRHFNIPQGAPVNQVAEPNVAIQENKFQEPVKAEVPSVVEDKVPAPIAPVEVPVQDTAKEEQPKVSEVPEAVEIPKPAEAQKDLFGNEIYSLRRPAITVQDEVENQSEVKPEPAPIMAAKPAEPEQQHLPQGQPHLQQFDAVLETPTLVQHIPPQKETPREINQMVSTPQVSLNDRLKQEKTELAHKLKETPVKDLRKAIGINDKFLFVSELFRGDEAMYERSIKTINGFHILQEAEYWMNRELKVKLGWNDNKDTVQHFYHLVRRRFS